MDKNISVLRIPAKVLIALAFVVVALLASPVTWATVHNITLTAETLPNGQFGYKMDGEAQAVTPGPTLFVEVDDTIHVTLTNNTSVAIGFKVPGLPGRDRQKAQPGQTQSFTVAASKAGTYSLSR